MQTHVSDSVLERYLELTDTLILLNEEHTRLRKIIEGYGNSETPHYKVKVLACSRMYLLSVNTLINRLGFDTIKQFISISYYNRIRVLRKPKTDLPKSL